MTQQSRPKLVTPKQVAQAIGVSEASVKRWCNQGQIASFRTVGLHRRLPIDAVIQFIRASGRPLVRPELIGLPSATGQGQIVLNRAAEQVKAALLAGDEDQVRRIVFDLYLAGNDTHSICDHVLAVAFRQIGNAWEHGAAEIYQERHACEMCLRVLHEWERMLAPPPEGAPVAIGGTLEGDSYQLATTMVGLVLREARWQADSYGASNPADTLRSALETLRPKLFWLSASYVPSAEKFVDECRSLRKTATAVGAAFIMGGWAITPEIRRALRGVAYAETMRELVTFATPHFVISPPAPPPERQSRIVY